ncbi:MAG: hypothetical protein IJA45_03235 [Oscillospiraceae bacterium]|nr:hypothetical protein [Oscillospiraceae bacterium]
MRILIITTYYPPDTAIAAVRPYMFAKYLKQYGHDVTVLRSGEFFNDCENFFENIPGVQVISYLGENSPAEVFARGEWEKPSTQPKSRIGFLPEKVRKPIARFYHRIMQPRELARHMMRRNQCLEKQKAALDQLKSQGNSFDIVFSTFGEIENIFAGQYAAKIFDCKLVQDFRDSAARSPFLRRRWLKKLQKIQREAVSQADAVTAVSSGLLSELTLGVKSNFPEMVLHNGYEPIANTMPACNDSPEAGLFAICYTGLLYAGMSDFSPLLQALSTLKEQGKIDLSKVRIHYAGPDFNRLQMAAAQFQLTEIVVDHGYVSRTEAARLQATADIFTVLSWNTESSQGILTGKFYEGIRAGKPILSIISGNVPHSELDLLNQKYQYGFCYEICRNKEQFHQLCDYLEKAYREKMELGSVAYVPDPALQSDFRYDTLAKKLESLCIDLMQEKQPPQQA